ncbi:MAG: type II toxin-antitoxin system VapC family toxin [Campylobacterota bacterium]|nr:type II toxin-antitoxin system VapC family toxin [Campylobacterota bacterium]
METIFIDTHVVVWLFAKEMERFSSSAITLIEHNDLAISPMVISELGLLYEIRRINYSPQQIMASLQQSIGLQVSDISFEVIAYQSTEILWTRDPFDRIITATAMVNGAKLLTKDRMILKHYENAVW